MAQRRMFSKTITESDIFLDMPLSTQALYFHLGMQADDDGFVSPNRITRMIGSLPDDLKILFAKQLVIPFESGIVVIRHWRENNYIQNDRRKDTLYLNELQQLNMEKKGVYSLYPECIQNVRVGKVSIVKVSKGKDSIVADRDMRAVVYYWNEKDILTTHTEEALKRKMQKKHRDIVTELRLWGVFQAIDNYCAVLTSDDHYFDYKWPLWDFLVRGVDQFVGTADPLNNFLRKKQGAPVDRDENARMVEEIKNETGL